jgi:hypothetical protein
MPYQEGQSVETGDKNSHVHLQLRRVLVSDTSHPIGGSLVVHHLLRHQQFLKWSQGYSREQSFRGRWLAGCGSMFASGRGFRPHAALVYLFAATNHVEHSLPVCCT